MKTIFTIMLEGLFILAFFAYALLPIGIAILPVIPYVMTDNGALMFWMILTFPIGAAVALRTWTPNSINEMFNVLKMKKLFAFAIIALIFTSCTENYSNGERIGLVTQFSQTGLIFKSWEGHLNLTQTGMNSSSAAPFDFSIDNDHQEPEAIALIDSAANLGWKIKITYHETAGKNWFGNRGSTDHFVTKVEVLDKSPIANAFGNHDANGKPVHNGVNAIHDTIYVVIVEKSRLK